jgi:hypothetical protein
MNLWSRYKIRNRDALKNSAKKETFEDIEEYLFSQKSKLFNMN